MKKPMLAFHNKQSVKDKYIKRVRAHYKADEIIHGTYWQNGKGCAIGCTIEGSRHERYETELGIPQAIARLEDTIFEGLENGEAKKFPLQFLEAIEVGADLNQVSQRFILWLLTDPKGITKNALPDGKKAIKQVAKLYERALNGEIITQEEWAAWSAAWSAAESAAWSAAWSAAESAAWSAAWSAAASAAASAAWSAAWSAAESAAWSAAASAAASAAWSAAWSAAASAAWSAAWSAAESAAYKRQAKYLLKLLKDAK